MGPPGNCPCIQKARGEVLIPLKETYISPDLFALLPEEDQKTINNLKHKALGLYLASLNKSEEP